MGEGKLTDALIERIKKCRSGIEVDLLLEKAGVPEPKASGCGLCDFSSGTRGMDRCSQCDGVGSIFRVDGMPYPNTEQGYIQAVVATLTKGPSNG